VPPFVPAACILLGQFMRQGHLTALGDLSRVPWRDHLLDWLLGSLVLAPVLAVFAGVIIYQLAVLLQKKEVRTAT
jgi:hypothetical protein